MKPFIPKQVLVPPKSKKQLFEIYILPIIVGLLLYALFVFIISHFYFNKIDRVLGYSSCVAAGLYLFFKKRAQYNPKPLERKISTYEPTAYVATFSLSITRKITYILLSILVIIVSGVIYSADARMIPLFTLCFGLWGLYKSIQEFLDKRPLLKIGEEGLWTRKLGFLSWKKIKKIKIGRLSQSYYDKEESQNPSLEIYLDDFFYEESIELNEIENKEEIEVLLKKYKHKIKRKKG